MENVYKTQGAHESRSFKEKFGNKPIYKNYRILDWMHQGQMFRFLLPLGQQIYYK